MRNVAKRMLMADTAQCVISWKMKVLEMLNQKRGEAVMKRVGLRMLNKDLSISYCNWRDKYMEAKNKERGEQIMRRVGARMMKKELTTNWDAWVQNYKENMLEMVRSQHTCLGWGVCRQFPYVMCWAYFCCDVLGLSAVAESHGEAADRF